MPIGAVNGNRSYAGLEPVRPFSINDDAARLNRTHKRGLMSTDRVICVPHKRRFELHMVGEGLTEVCVDRLICPNAHLFCGSTNDK
jgi:hypothetical protein